MYRKSSRMSDSWSCSRRSRRPINLINSQEFEKVDSLNSSLDVAMIKSVSLPEDLISRREETYFERVKNFGTNLRFNLGTIGEKYWPDDSKKHKAYLLGKEYEIEKLEHIKKMREEFCDIIWFSYRKNFPTLNYKLIPLSESFVSDTGWGCMIRVCQMLFAECLKRHKINRKAFGDGKQSRISSQAARELDAEEKKEINLEIISWFLDTEIDKTVSPYSIQNLSVCLHERFKLKPGLWLKPSSVLFALQEIHANSEQEKVEDLQIEIYLESTIYVAQALKKVKYMPVKEITYEEFAEEFEVVEDNGSGEEEEGQENYEPNGENISIQPTESQNIHQDNNERGDAVPSPVAKEEEEEDIEDVSPKIEENEQQPNEPNGDDSLESIYMNDAREIEKLLKHKWKDSLIIFILAKIGLDRPNPEYIPFIKDLMSYPESVGIIGGKPGLAYYIVGYSEDKLMYLDPHFVQEAVKKEDLKENIHTYFTNTIRHVNFNDIDTSLTFGFFIKDEVTFKSFLDRFRQSCQDHESFLGVELNAPQENTTDVESVCEEYGEENNNKKVRDEDGFEML